jgi:hypothetical protein
MGRGRPRLTEAEKLERGTLRAGRTDEDYAKQDAAKIHAFPKLRKIPESTVPLGVAGQREFDLFTRQLFDAGHLTELTLRAVENLAMAKDTVHALSVRGKAVPVALLNQIDRSLKDLRLANADSSLSPIRPAENPFSRNGFAARGRREVR